MANKNNNKNFDMDLPQLFWLDGDSLTKKIADINKCLAWCNSQGLEYNKQIKALEKVLKALYCIRDNSKILIGE